MGGGNRDRRKSDRRKMIDMDGGGGRDRRRVLKTDPA